LNQIEILSKLVGFKLPLGASNPQIISIGKQIYNVGGLNLLNKIAKIDFRITQKITLKTN
jgi:ribonuclease HIII